MTVKEFKELMNLDEDGWVKGIEISEETKREIMEFLRNPKIVMIYHGNTSTPKRVSDKAVAGQATKRKRKKKE
ncbi:MAG: hypothetical protein NZL95_01105 [Chitinophagales bacterium]|nr:hypothetical protein [Chitinophagales bacterium]MDW8427134.1 hypothetical protein [Chitinophagales bacterium]